MANQETASTYEQRILDRLERVLPKLSVENKMWLLGLGEGLAMMQRNEEKPSA